VGRAAGGFDLEQHAGQEEGTGMPPLIVWALGALGALVLGRWIAAEARRRSAELRARRAEGVGPAERERAPTLRRDPVTGIYRPK